MLLEYKFEEEKSTKIINIDRADAPVDMLNTERSMNVIREFIRQVPVTKENSTHM